MPRNRNSLKYELKRLALQNTGNGKNNRTRVMYKRCINQFTAWAKEKNCKYVEDITKDTIQEYEEFLEEHPKSYSEATIHTYLAPICVAAGVPMEEIRKPKRLSGNISRSRRTNTVRLKEKNLQGLQEEKNLKYARVVALEKAVGIRRAELAKLCGEDLDFRDGDCFIVVRRGKGGKRQEQYILPQDVDIVRAIFQSVGAEEKVFSKEEMNNKIDFHGMRAAHARRCYAYYVERIEADQSFAADMRFKLMERWLEAHEPLCFMDSKSWLRQRTLFEQEMDDRPYKLRGDNLSKALASGAPTEYNRLALMCVSVLHLSHWRLDVTVTNYVER